MKNLTELLNSSDPSIVEFAHFFEEMLNYGSRMSVSLTRVRISKLTLGQIARALNTQTEVEKSEGITKYWLDLEIGNQVVRFWCSVPEDV